MDVHKEAIVIAVQNESGKLVMESVIETKASSILQLLHGLRGELHVTWEEGTWAATQTLLAALEIATCKVVAHVRDRRTTVDFLSLMDDVVKSYPVSALHVVLDNLNIHKNEAAKQWLLSHPRVHFHYTPTHASWMNMVECFFSILTRQALTQSVHRSKKELKEFLIRYLKQYSENPTSFTWTKGPEHLQRIFEATRQYQAAHPKQAKQRKDRQHNAKN
jgi:hypothetical protein